MAAIATQTDYMIIRHFKKAGIVWLGLMFLLAGCGGLSSEPTIISTAPVPTVTPTAPPDVGHPTARIDLAAGSTIFNGAQGCQNCHGVGGKGNGSVAANFTCTIPNASDPNVARVASIAEWFSITTNGNGGATSCLMPPWASTLNEQQRWNVTSYLYSLQYNAAQLQAGAQVWQSNCASCHGSQGAGDGPQAKGSARPLPNFTDPAALLSLSDTDLYNSVTNGVAPAMPAYAKSLDDNARWAVTAYLRTLAWDHVDTVINNGGVPASNTTNPNGANPPASVPANTTPLTVTGTLTNGTPGGLVPVNLPITLHIIKTTANADGSTTSSDTSLVQGVATNGKFSLPNVPRQIGQAYVITTSYAGVQQFSTPIQVDQTTDTQIDLPLTVYDLGAPPDSIAITQETLILDFPDPNTIVVNEGVNFKNTGKQIAYTISADGKQHTSIGLPLPIGTGNVQIAPQVQGEFALNSSTDPAQAGQIVSTLPLLPSESRPLQFSYTLNIPHPNGSATIALPTPYSVQAFNLYLPQTIGITISDPNFPSAAPISLTDANNQPIQYDGFQLAAPLAAGKSLTLALQSKSDLLNADADSRRNTLAIVITLALSVFAVTGLIVYRIGRVTRLQVAAAGASGRAASPVAKRGNNPIAPAPADLLLNRIAALDDQLAQGTINQADYIQRRDQLKAMLMQAITNAEKDTE